MAIGTLPANEQQVLYLPYYLQQFQSSQDMSIYNAKEKENNSVDKKAAQETAFKPAEKNEKQEKTDISNKSQFDASAYKLDLTLNFSPENLKKSLTNVLNGQNQLPESKEKQTQKNDTADTSAVTPFLAVGLSVDAERVQKISTGTGGTGQTQNIHIRASKTTKTKDSATYQLDQIKLKIQRRQSEKIKVQLDVVHRDGYRVTRQRISQRYQENVSLQAELLSKFDSTTQKVAEKQPEATGTFLNTTDKLVQNNNISGKTISKFFDVVESYVDKTKQALHGQIDKFMDTISKDFNISDEKLKEMRSSLHTRVDQFFDAVNKIVGTMENEALQALVPDESKKPEPLVQQAGTTPQIA